jgi:MFS family permease
VTTDSSLQPLSLLKHAVFRHFWCARVLSALSFQMVGVALGWQIYALTHSAYALGLVGLAQFLPMFALTLVVGHVADRYDRRVIVATCQAVNGVAALTLALGSWQGWLSTHAIYALAACVGAARAFEQPTIAALLPGLVPREVLQRAMALATSAGQTAQILGPALGGVLYGFGPTTVYACAAAAFLSASTLIATIRVRPQVNPREPVTLRSVFSGIAFIRSQPVILGAISLDLFAVLLGGATALLPLYARDILHVGPQGLGLLRSAPAVGALLGALVLARRPLQRAQGRAMFAAVLVFGVATMVFGVSRYFYLSLAALFVTGCADVVSVVVRQSLVQLGTPDAMRGRVAAVNSMFVGTSNQLGEFESGVAAGLLGAVPAVLVGGLGTVLVAVVWMKLFPKLRGIDRLDGLGGR